MENLSQKTCTGGTCLQRTTSPPSSDQTGSASAQSSGVGKFGAGGRFAGVPIREEGDFEVGRGRSAVEEDVVCLSGGSTRFVGNGQTSRGEPVIITNTAENDDGSTQGSETDESSASGDYNSCLSDEGRVPRAREERQGAGTRERWRQEQRGRVEEGTGGSQRRTRARKERLDSGATAVEATPVREERAQQVLTVECAEQVFPVVFREGPFSFYPDRVPLCPLPSFVTLRETLGESMRAEFEHVFGDNAALVLRA